MIPSEMKDLMDLLKDFVVAVNRLTDKVNTLEQHFDECVTVMAEEIKQQTSLQIQQSLDVVIHNLETFISNKLTKITEELTNPVPLCTPEPTPVQPTPAPEPVNPVQPTPELTPVQPTPAPVNPVPVATPEPVQPTPEPEPAPVNPVQSAPEPTPVQPTPAPETEPNPTTTLRDYCRVLLNNMDVSDTEKATFLKGVDTIDLVNQGNGGIQAGDQTYPRTRVQELLVCLKGANPTTFKDLVTAANQLSRNDSIGFYLILASCALYGLKNSLMPEA